MSWIELVFDNSNVSHFYRYLPDMMQHAGYCDERAGAPVLMGDRSVGAVALRGLGVSRTILCLVLRGTMALARGTVRQRC